MYPYGYICIHKLNVIKLNPTVKVAKDTFLIQVYSDRVSDLGIIGANGNKITIDTDYNKYKHAVQIGRIFACPVTITDQYLNDTELKEGDVVVFHHFVCQPDHKVDVAENVYRAEYFHLYAKLEYPAVYDRATDTAKIMTEVYPLEDAIFVEPILEDESNMFAGKIRIKTHQENLKQQGIVFASSKKARDMGVLPGDKIYFTLNADYAMHLCKKDLYRMRIRNIVAVERNNELVCIEGKVLVKEDPQEKKIGSLYDVRGGTQMIGMVMSVGGKVYGVQPGEKIAYYAGTNGMIEYKGSNYAFIEMRHINYVIEGEQIT